MKKFLSILLILIYSTATFGMTVKEFYCCGKLASVSISFNADSKKTCGNKVKSGGCCKTKFHFSKIKDNHQAADALKLPVKHIAHLDIYLPVLNSDNTSIAQVNTASGVHDPPILHSSTPVYIFIRVLRI